MRFMKRLLAFAREFSDISEHARTGRRPATRRPAAAKR